MCLAALQHNLNQLPALLPLLIQLECSCTDSATPSSTPSSSPSSTLQRLMALPILQADFSHLSESRMGTSASAMVSDLLRQPGSTLAGDASAGPGTLSGAASGATAKAGWADGLPGKLSMHSAPLSHSQSSGDRLIKALRPRTEPQQQGRSTSPLASHVSSPHGKPPTHRPAQGEWLGPIGPHGL